MTVECFYPGEQLSVVADRDEDLRVGSNGGLEDTERTGAEFVLLQLADFVLAVDMSVGN